MWLKALVWPNNLIMRFVRASKEADCPLHIHTLKFILPYFAAAGHCHYLSYASVYSMKMTNIPKNLLKKVLDGEHAMWHQNGIWNSIWSDMMIETTVMRFGHGPNGMAGLTFNEKSFSCWAKSLNLFSVIESNLLDLKEALRKHFKRCEPSQRRRVFTNYQERSRKKKSVNLYTPFCIHPVEIGSEQVKKFHQT